MRKIKNEELNRLSVEEFKKVKKMPFVVVLDNVRSQHNIGSVFRTADAFLVEAIYLCGITAQPPNKEIHKTALGATESVQWHYYANTLDAVNHLREAGYKIIAIEQVEGAILLPDYPVNQNTHYAVIFGNEIHGVDQQVINNCDEYIEIPQKGTKHSINVSISAGIVIWEFFRKLVS